MPNCNFDNKNTYHDNDRLLPSDVHTTKCQISKTTRRNSERSRDDDDGDDDDGDDDNDDDGDDDGDGGRSARRLVNVQIIIA